MTNRHWLFDLASASDKVQIDGLVFVDGYISEGRSPEEVTALEKAEEYGATAVFFQAATDNKPPVPQAFIYASEGPEVDPDFAKVHQRLWSWGGVPIAYRVTPGLAQLFRCAHKPEFVEKKQFVFRPYDTLHILAEVQQVWWNFERLRNGTLWDTPHVCADLLSSDHSAQRALLREVKQLHARLSSAQLLPSPLQRKLLILSLLIAYLEARDVFEEGFFSAYCPGASRFFEVLAEGTALRRLLTDLEQRFNGGVFSISSSEEELLLKSNALPHFARLIEARSDITGQLSLWERYSFADLPVELISQIYQLFVTDKSEAVYTPQVLVRLMVTESLDWKRIDRIQAQNEVILDPSCGSGVFLVEAYKRLVLHWRLRNNWKRPDVFALKNLLASVRGIDVEDGAVELASFSLCLALCDALKPHEIRSSVKLFPELRGTSIISACFFEACEQNLIAAKIGVVLGNPPFTSKLKTKGAERAYNAFKAGTSSKKNKTTLPDKQVAYLFLDQAMRLIQPGGILALLQPYGFLYNQKTQSFRKEFFRSWKVREILDFVSIRGIFQQGDADTKVVVVVSEATEPDESSILHATFRRTGRADAEQSFDVDYYDIHWINRELALDNDSIWRCNLLGGRRVLDFVTRLKTFPTIEQHAKRLGWAFGEGFTRGSAANGREASHVIGHQYVTCSAFTDGKVDLSKAEIVKDGSIERPRRKEIYTAPLLLVHKQLDLSHGFLSEGYVTYQHEIVGFSESPEGAKTGVADLANWLASNQRPLRAFVAASSFSGLVSKATAILAEDIKSIPVPQNGDLDLSDSERIIVDDILDYYSDLMRLGEGSSALKDDGHGALSEFCRVFESQVNAIYSPCALKAAEPFIESGLICQPFVFGAREVDWNHSSGVFEKLSKTLRTNREGVLLTRIARIYDGPCVFLLKPNQKRYWLKSVALTDSDGVVSDLWAQGF